jgi:hypothetical protein
VDHQPIKVPFFIFMAIRDKDGGAKMGVSCHAMPSLFINCELTRHSLLKKPCSTSLTSQMNLPFAIVTEYSPKVKESAWSGGMAKSFSIHYNAQGPEPETQTPYLLQGVLGIL